jgi:hypothetical protein
LTADEFDIVIKKYKLDDIKEEVFTLYSIPKGHDKSAAKSMIKAYLVHALDEVWH